MKKVLFTHSYFLQFDAKQQRNGQPYAPLGTLYAAAVMRENGYEVSLFDTMFAKAAEEVERKIDAVQPCYFVIYDDGFNYLTKMCLTNMREAAFKMIRIAKQRNCTVIISSSDSTDHFAKYLSVGADFILLGEAEHTLLELINFIEEGECDYCKIKGIAFNHNGATVKTIKREILKDLNSLPFPAWDLVDIEKYKQIWLKNSGYFSINIATTRGCPFKCNWCAKPIYGNRYNSRSPQNVVQELKMLKAKYNFDHIWFCDDIFGLKPGWVNEFAALIEKERLSIRFKIQSRADLLVDENYCKDLAKAGCDNVWMGAESGSQKVLDSMDKGITISQIAEATKLLKKYSIKPSFFIQFGYIGETKEDIKKTIKMVSTLLPHEIGVSVSYPLPGTKFYERVKNELKEKTNWTDSDELKLLFTNTYSPAFYKKLHRHVHHEFRKQQGVAAIKKMSRRPLSTSWKDCKKAVLGFLFVPRIFVERLQLKLYA
jgi:anaerobic magnesium-protoporphyrin IX monomethyl ester cyclase